MATPSQRGRAMLGYFISQTRRRYRTILRPRVVVGVPSGITQVERRAFRDAAMYARARAVYLVEQPVAAAMGAGLPIQEPGGNLTSAAGPPRWQCFRRRGSSHSEASRSGASLHPPSSPQVARWCVPRGRRAPERRPVDVAYTMAGWRQAPVRITDRGPPSRQCIAPTELVELVHVAVRHRRC